MASRIARTVLARYLRLDTTYFWQETDLKSILEDMRDELGLLREENRRLKDDSMSGQSLVTSTADYGEEFPPNEHAQNFFHICMNAH
jgi:hypothetical protein